MISVGPVCLEEALDPCAFALSLSASCWSDFVG